MQRSVLSLAFSLSVLIALPRPTSAVWPLNGAAVSTATNGQSDPVVVSDGAGGAIVVWEDYRTGQTDIYAGRIDASGNTLWTLNGVALCTAANNQNDPVVVTDGAGGATVAWLDFRSGNWDIYARRIDASGNALWTADGVALCTAANEQSSARVVSDGAGGAIVTWLDARSGPAYDVYARRIDASGNPLWTADGVALCTAAGMQNYPAMASDSAGGAIVAWADGRGGLTYDIYARRIDASGNALWTADGVALCTAADTQANPAAVSDGAGGAIVAWRDFRSGTSFDIYARRIDASGNALWTSNGAAICTAANDQNSPDIDSDGAGGAIIVWSDNRTGTNLDIYAHRIDALGNVPWSSNGVALCTAANAQDTPEIVSDGVGGAIVSWSDNRTGTNLDIYARRIDAVGNAMWTSDGVAVCTAVNEQYLDTIGLIAGGAIVAWRDFRSNTTHIYAQRLELDFGHWGRPEPAVTSVGDVPGDQGGKVAVNWKRSEYDVVGMQTITHYSIWRAVDSVAAAEAAGASSDVEAWVDPASVGLDFPGPALSHERIGATDYYWEWLANQSATQDAGYSFTAPTREDSLAGDPALHYFRVLAHTSNAYVLYKSNTVSGYSVDNLAPAAPLQLTAQRIGADVHLHWNRVTLPDLRDYAVYRATSTGVTPVPINFLASADDTVLIDASAPTSSLYYIVTAYDIHENQSGSSNEASVSATTDVGNTPPIRALTVLQNRPNPFKGSTVFAIGLPSSSNVEIEVYDVAGRRVRELTLERQEKGWQSVYFDGRDDGGRMLPSGVYFYRVNANGATVTRKMVVTR